jgi:predicted murein hydrolase (TIGR00659 family)
MGELLASPLFAVTLTLGVYAGASALYARWRCALLNPLLVTIVAIIGVLLALGIPYATYDAGGRLLSFFLGPAVVALGLPLAERWDEIRRQGRAIGVAVGIGSVVGVLSAAGTAALLGASPEVVLSLAPRAVTTPIAIGIAERIGGEPSLAAAFVIGSGIVGAVVGPAVLRALGVRRRAAFGLAMGAAAHGIGTARALEEAEAEGASAGLAIALMGIGTAAVAPPLAALVLWLMG